MAESTFPSLRTALNRTLSRIRSGFGHKAKSPKQELPEADTFLARLEAVLGIEILAVDPPPQPQQLKDKSVAEAIHLPEPAVFALPSAAANPAGAPVPKPRPGRKSSRSASVDRRRAAKSAARRRTGKRKKPKAAKAPAPVLVPQTEITPQSASAAQVLAGTPPKPARPRRQALGPQGILVSTALVHVPRLKPALPAHDHRAGHPLPDLLGIVQPASPVYSLAPRQIQAQTLADQPSARQKKKSEQDDSSPFSVSVGQVYDGPLDLLLDLIRRQDIDIYDIPIATITAQFLSYVNQLKASDVDVAGEFIYTASLLIHIKSKMLLPRSPSGPDDAPEDPRRELVERLLEHERFKNAAQMLQQKQMLEAATWSNPGFREFQNDAAAEPEIAADTTDLVRIFRDILERARKRPVLDVQEDSVTVGQMIQFLARRLSIEDKPVALRRLLSHTRSERALIAMFLALLELVRLQAVLLRQDHAFSEIFIKKHTGFDAMMNDGVANALDDWR